jgi:hypothetical protein
MQDRLDSWKEIAVYLKRGARTVQRWENDEGLPVHRLRHDKLGSVCNHGIPAALVGTLPVQWASSPRLRWPMHAGRVRRRAEPVPSPNNCKTFRERLL